MPNYSDQSDESIAKIVQQGDSEAYGEIMSRYEAKLNRYTRRFLADPHDAEDVVQEVFIKAYKNIQSFDPGRKFSSWIYRITHNECINLLRKNRIQGESLSIFDLDTLFPRAAREENDGKASQKEIKELLDSALDKLDVKYRELLILYYLEGFDYKEIADILHIPIPTVGVRMSRGRIRLKEHYEKLIKN